MSKQSVARQRQGYNPKPTHPMCQNCMFYRSEMVEHGGAIHAWTEEKNKRCSLGGFAVKKTATCQSHELKKEG